MKKILILSFLISIFSFNVQAQDFLNQAKMNSIQEFRDSGYKRLGIAFRHHPRPNQNCMCPNCACPGCTCPIGLCICIDLRPIVLGDEDELTDPQIAAGYGIVWVKIVNNQMHLIFETTNDEDEVMDVNGGGEGGSEAADDTDATKFGAPAPFSIISDNYTVIKTKYDIGETVVDISYD